MPSTIRFQNRIDGISMIPVRLKIRAADEHGMKAIAMLEELFLGTGIAIDIVVGCDEKSDVDFLHDAAMAAHEEQFNLSADMSGIRITYGDRMGARNGAAAFYSSITSRNGYFYMEHCEIEDWPDCSFRSVMLDPARLYIPMDKIFTTIRQAALGMMNKFNLHLCDSGRYAIESVRVPELNHQNLRRYTIDEIRQIIGYADLFGLEVIPHFDVPAHASHILDCFPALRCEIDDGAIYSSWAVCAGKEETYDLLERVLEELAEIFPSPYVFVCGDELEFADLPEEKLWLNWQHCVHCKKLSRENGYADNTAVFYHFIRRVHAILNKLGKRMMLANDNIDISQKPEIPKDILIVYWRIAMQGRGPVEGCTMQRFLEEGFEIINMDYPEAYIDLYMTEEKLQDWSPVKRPFCSDDHRSQVLGSMICAWEGKRHYEWSLPSGIMMFGDKLWNYEDKVYNEKYYGRVLHRLLGPKTPAELDVFSLLGACLLPLDEDSARMGFPERFDITAVPAIETAVSSLEQLIADGIREEETAKVYIRCLRWMKQQLEQKQAEKNSI